jgi:hypothetical protein
MLHASHAKKKKHDIHLCVPFDHLKQGVIHILQGQESLK